MPYPIMTRALVISLSLTMLLVVTGCANPLRSPPLFGQFQAFRPGTRTLDLDAVIDRAAKADVILLGEEHNDVVCNQLEAELLGGLLARGIRPALSMEFLERDVQPVVDKYLAGTLDEAAFIKAARLGKNYAWSHRPLIEMAKAYRLPVVASNAPRESVRAYRQSEQEYAQFRATLSPEKAALLPESVDAHSDAYRARFFSIMGLNPHEASVDQPSPHAVGTMPAVTSAPASAPSGAAAAGAHGPITPAAVERMYQAQLVWDAAMAQSIEKQRRREPRRKVLHIVGSFHVEQGGGTMLSYCQRMPRDRVLPIIYHGAKIGDAGDERETWAPGGAWRGRVLPTIQIRGVRADRSE